MKAKPRQTVFMIAPLGDPSRRVRLAKVISLLRDGHDRDIVYAGWAREKSEPLGRNIEGVVASHRLLSGGGYRSRFTRPLYLLWIMKVFFFLLWRAPREVYALGLETALPAWMASRIRPRIRYIFDDADRLLTFWTVPGWAYKLILFFEKRTSKASVYHIVPTFGRYEYENARMIEISNLPNEDQIDAAQSIEAFPRNDKLNVYVNGWLDPTRGLNLLDGAAARLIERGRDDIVFNVAIGRLTEERPAFFSRPNVNHLGSLTHVESLAEYRRNQLVVTFYDPAIRVNRFAVPNKWGDAIVMGTPIIANSEVETARSLLDAGAAFAIPFHDGEALAELLVALKDNPGTLDAARQAIIRVRPLYETFDKAMAPVLGKLLAPAPQH